jgi:hypothetical protein
MATLRSPGVLIREKDLTNGRADATLNNIAGFAAPFQKGEIGSPILVSTESDLINFFGEPVEQNAEYWLSATNFLSYGGTLSVVRVDTENNLNAIARVGNYVSEIAVTNASTNGKYISAPAVTLGAPDIAGGTQAQARAIINAQGRVNQIVIEEAGSGYTSAPSVTVAPVGVTATGTVARGTTATATANAGNLNAGALTGTATISNAGSGYQTAPSITVSGGGGNGGVATATVTNGQISSITLSGGTGYTSAPTLQVAQPNGLVVTITSGGTNYDSAETYAVAVTGGTAVTPFAATATIVNGAVTNVTVTNFGNYSNFTNLAVTFPAPGTTATATATIAAEPVKIENPDVYEAQYTGNSSGWLFAAKTPGEWGNNLRVCVVDAGPHQSLRLATENTNVAVGNTVTTAGGKEAEVIDVTTTTIDGIDYTSIHVVITDSGNYVSAPAQGDFFTTTDVIDVGSQQDLVIAAVDDGSSWYSEKVLYPGSSVRWNSLAARPVATADAAEFFGSVAVRDAVHVAIVDEDGGVTGAKGSVVEVFTYLSKATDARGPEGGNNYYKKVVSDSSLHVYTGDTLFENQGKVSAFVPKGALSYPLVNGSIDWQIGISDLNDAYDAFRDLDNVNVDYLIVGPGLESSTGTAQKINHIAGIAAYRKDCIAFASPHKGHIISGSGTPLKNQDITNNLKAFFRDIVSTSYLVLDCNYKYVYDRWNDRYRYIPCNTDVAGLVADTALNAEPWFSPAGFSRGGIRNAAKLAWSPNKVDRDELYANRINPIATFPGQGPVLFGDKTALATPSAFDRINVRRLFLVLERAIEAAAKAQLFEINDETTRNVFKAIVEPFLRDVQSRRGLYDFLLVCDGTNNTPAVIDRNEFVADIYIQPARSINFITLTFTATRTGISFSEAIAK